MTPKPGRTITWGLHHFSHSPELSHMTETYLCGKLGNHGLPMCAGRKNKLYQDLVALWHCLCPTSLLLSNRTATIISVRLLGMYHLNEVQRYTFGFCFADENFEEQIC